MSETIVSNPCHTTRRLLVTGAAIAALALPTIESRAAAGDSAASSAAGAYLAANFAQDANDVAAAARYMAEALKTDPDNPDLIGRAFVLALAGGEMPTAVDLAARLRQSDGGQWLSATLLAADEVRHGRFDSALAGLETIEAYGMAQFVLPLARAWIHAGLGEQAEALDALEPMLGMEGFSSLANLHKGLILDFGGDLDGAGQALAQARGLGNALRLVQALGSVLERSGQVDEARALYDEYAAENPDSLLLEPLLARLDRGEAAPALIGDPVDGLAEALFHIATALNQERASDQAMMVVRVSLHLRPDLELAQMLLAESLVRADRNEEALAIYRAIPDRSPTAWTARLSEANALDRLERTDEAIAVLKALADQRTDQSGPLVRLADLLRGESQFQNAVEAYDRAATRSPQLAEEDWTFLYRRGIALERAKAWQRAENDLVRAIDLNPDHAFLLNYLGYSWIDRGENLAEGEELIRRAIEIEPNDGSIVDSLGWALYRTGRVEEAVTILERAVELRSEDAVINDHLGDALWMAGRRTEARFQWRRALRTADDEEMILTIEDKLARGMVESGIMDGPTTAGEPPAATP
ncbi:MAG: tetratricopeptide repeat protein [Inquilinus sp.]|nr:tetratricopeptide repeat protein [Inquilinus sp.]